MRRSSTGPTRPFGLGSLGRVVEFVTGLDNAAGFTFQLRRFLCCSRARVRRGDAGQTDLFGCAVLGEFLLIEASAAFGVPASYTRHAIRYFGSRG